MQTKFRWRIVAALFALVLAASACGGDSSSDDTASGDTSAGTSGTDSGTDSDTDTEVTLAASGGDLLNEVIARDTLNCGVSGSAVAFSELQPDGSMQGFDADFCRVVAAAIFGDATKVNFVSLTAAERFTAVQTGDVDVLMRNTTWTQSRDSDVGMDFGPTTYYDGQQLLARAGDGFDGSSQIVDIDGAVVCTSAGTTTEKNIADAASEAGVAITLNTYEDFDMVTNNFIAGACDIITTDGSALVGRKAKQQPADQEWVIFPATPISKEPLGPTYGQNDSAFADVVNWAVYATVIADEKGVTAANASEMKLMGDTETIRLLGGEGELQTAMGLSADAFYQVITQVGNYDEIYTRNLGPVGLSRVGSSNASWTNGGLVYAPPAR
ncbi:MAG: general L-amino acid transport system substrate-binding protein [Candidatus Poriferisodalaceae bacterium]|jgi:general L-amino acid transport system substrate-binding protein|nr:transporter substrate-binding domain-containing protein [Acidimicrobiales bacterium]|tara:strand:- start:31452 stop:32600 length:1149 start_codon:yes stop_codon:yes gene_type:complete